MERFVCLSLRSLEGRPRSTYDFLRGLLLLLLLLWLFMSSLY